LIQDHQSRDRVENGRVKIQVVHIDECPNWETTGDRVQAVLGRLGLPDVPVEFVLVETLVDAAAVGFAGSPTVLVDGEDVVPSAGQTTNIACRVYATETGLAGLPSESQIEAGIRARLS